MGLSIGFSSRLPYIDTSRSYWIPTEHTATDNREPKREHAVELEGFPGATGSSIFATLSSPRFA
jgi:hypothetical protein